MVKPSELNQVLSLPTRYRWLISFAVGSMLIIGGIVYTSRDRPSPVSPSVHTPVATTINALGRLEPAGKVIQVSAPSGQVASSRVIELRVKAGDRVQTGQIIAVLDSRDRFQAALAETKRQIEVATTRLAQVKAGVEPEEILARRAAVTRLEAQLAGEIQTQAATTARLKAQVKDAEMSLQRSQSLFTAGAVSEEVLDAQRLEFETAQEILNEQSARVDQTSQVLEAQIREARAVLEQTIAVQPTDVAVAQAEVNQAIANADRLQAELETAFIRAPQDGQVLGIQTRAGETVGNEGIIELGNTEQMIVVAEVFESDIGEIQQGQSATAVSSTGVFLETLQGTVNSIGLQIAKRDVLDTDPTAVTDARVVEVEIRLDEESTKIVAGLTNLQVNVKIQK
ncbi:family abc transporter membrane fusion protein [Leptolyngbya sp. Heron Island J]|uniref:HlyD family efflux transporter periplasmic adaptor subunit n=1 Tax=Leptolyngbya sp. Heron Island J TaxID=1385935 RepID=UPI0003B9B355|nr:HlyD family efflux transporter periplasmic adaptor subunit [Leptolyngbya sp. Heron Island J]ESA37786.1 family abc transporter membrane fusion protein [Leptolyngbya sp. Heron Island J]